MLALFDVFRGMLEVFFDFVYEFIHLWALSVVAEALSSALHLAEFRS